MPEVRRVGDLEIGQDMEFESRMQRVEKVGWAVMGLIVLAALLGLFGQGVFSGASAGPEGGPLRVEYDRCLRYQSDQQVRVRLGPGAGSNGKARVWVSASYLEAFQVQRIDPPPEGVELGP